MKIYAETSDGTKIEITEIGGIDGEYTAIIFMMGCDHIATEDRYKIEKELSDKTGKNCIVLDARFTKVLKA